MKRKEVEQNIIEWAKDRELIFRENALKQVKKLKEEVKELKKSIKNDDYLNTIEEIGDCEVVLTILKEIMNVNQKEPLAAAWKKIKNRKGETVNGIFVKDEDIQPLELPKPDRQQKDRAMREITKEYMINNHHYQNMMNGIIFRRKVSTFLNIRVDFCHLYEVQLQLETVDSGFIQPVKECSIQALRDLERIFGVPLSNPELLEE